MFLALNSVKAEKLIWGYDFKVRDENLWYLIGSYFKERKMSQVKNQMTSNQD